MPDDPVLAARVHRTRRDYRRQPGRRRHAALAFRIADIRPGGALSVEDGDRIADILEALLADPVGAAPTVSGQRRIRDPHALKERQALLRTAAQFLPPGLSLSDRARILRRHFATFEQSWWRHHRAEPECDRQHQGRLEECFWKMLRLRDHVPSERTIRKELAVIAPTRC